MKNIGLFTSEFFPLRGGIGTYACELAKAATELGAQVTVHAPDYGQNLREEDKRQFPFEVARFSGARHTMKDLPAKLMYVRKALRQRQYSRIHAADWPFYLPVHFAAGPACKSYMVHGSEVIEMLAPAKAFVASKSGLFRPPAQVFTNSLFTRDLFLRHNPAVSADRVHAEWLGVSDFWLQPVNSTRVRHAHGIADDAFLMLTVGRLTPRKGHLDVLAALAKLPDAIKRRFCYGIVGPDYDAPYLAQIRAASAASGCEVKILGEVDDLRLRELYSAADLFCLTGREIANGPVEGFGLVYLEAGAQGLPALAGNLGGMPEAVVDGESGLVVDSKSTRAIADAITRLVEDESLRQGLATGAKKRARQLSWQRLAAATFGMQQLVNVTEPVA